MCEYRWKKESNNFWFSRKTQVIFKRFGHNTENIIAVAVFCIIKSITNWLIFLHLRLNQIVFLSRILQISQIITQIKGLESSRTSNLISAKYLSKLNLRDYFIFQMELINSTKCKLQTKEQLFHINIFIQELSKLPVYLCIRLKK